MTVPNPSTIPAPCRTGARIARAQRAMLLVLFVFTAVASGCSRTFWRRQADRDAYNLVGEKLNDPAWNVPRVDVTPDPRSRFYDPYDPDKGPLPPDDVAAGEYMLQVAGKKGYKSWHKFGQAFSIENPQWLESFGLTPEMLQNDANPDEPCEFELSLREILELSNIHSRDYQTAIEDVYLRALELSFERFQFDVRYLGIGGQRPTANLTQTSVPSTSDNLSLDTRGGVSQMLPSGGQWAVELANQTLWLFSGPNSMNTASTISYSIVQPLLFQAGRKIALENLTQSERTLLYSVRTLARFRKEFFTSVVGGPSGYLAVLQQQKVVSNELANINRNLEQLSILKVLASQQNRIYFVELNDLPQVFAGGFPGIYRGRLSYDPQTRRLMWRGVMTPAQRDELLKPNPPNPAWQAAVKDLVKLRLYQDLKGGPESINIPPELSGPATAETGRLSYDGNLKRLYWQGPMSEKQKKILRGLNPGGEWQTAVSGFINRLRAEIFTREILQLENRLASSRIRYRGARQRFQDLLDDFRLQLGLPPNIKICVDPTLLEAFQLIDQRVTAIEARLKGFVDEPAWKKVQSANPDPADVKIVIGKLKTLSDDIDTDVIKLIEADLRKLKERIANKAAPFNAKSNEDLSRVLEDIDRDEVLLRGTRRDYEQLSSEVQQLFDEFSKKGNKNEQSLRQGVDPAFVAEFNRQPAGKAAQTRIPDAIKRIAELREALRQITQNAQVVQIGLRVELISLEPLYRDPETGNPKHLPMDEAVAKALETRVDLKNAKAQVMDARRRVEVAANRLESVLNLRVEGDISTRAGNNKPLDFRGRQSNFRVGVGFTAPLDQVNARNQYRDAQIAYQRARRAYMALEDRIKLQVRDSYRQIDVLRQNFETAREQIRISASQFDIEVEAAAEPGQSSNRNSGLNLLTALANVLDSQNSLIQIWVSYEQTRLNIHRDMGIMEIDAAGVWLDDYYQQRFPTKPKNGNTTVLHRPATPEGPRSDATLAYRASKPSQSGLQRVKGSVRIRGDAGSLAERRRAVGVREDEFKRVGHDSRASGGTYPTRPADYQAADSRRPAPGRFGRGNPGDPVGTRTVGPRSQLVRE